VERLEDRSTPSVAHIDLLSFGLLDSEPDLTEPIRTPSDDSKLIEQLREAVEAGKASAPSFVSSVTSAHEGQQGKAQSAAAPAPVPRPEPVVTPTPKPVPAPAGKQSDGRTSPDSANGYSVSVNLYG
jgi:hypothetical protein